MRLQLSDKAKQAVKNTSVYQTWMFVCSNYSKSAVVVDAHISLALAKADAKKIGGCVRVGHVDTDGLAQTI